MRNISLVRMAAGWFAFGSAAVLCQGCGSTPGAVGEGASGNGGGYSINLGVGGKNNGFGGQYYGFGGQGGSRGKGTGGMVADAGSTDAPAARKDARIEGTGIDALAVSSTRIDGPQAADRPATIPDVRQAADQAVALDLPAKEAPVRVPPPVSDASVRLDLGAPDQPPPQIDGPVKNGLDAAAATACIYGGATYAVGDSFASDCNTCFCLASGEVVCTVKACPDGGALRIAMALRGWSSCGLRS